MIDIFSPHYCLSFWYHAMGRGSTKARVVLSFIEELKMSGKIKRNRKTASLFELRAFDSRSKTDWKYSQHNIRTDDEDKIYRNLTAYFLVASSQVQ